MKPHGRGSMGTQGGRTLLVLTNIPTPYRTNFFNALADEMSSRGNRLLVAYCARSEWHRDWKFAPADNRYDHVFLAGWSHRVGMLTFHFNPAIIGLLRRVRPTWVLAAGAWNMPTGLLALLLRRAARQPIIFWTEGHEGGVRHRGGVIPWIRRVVVRRYTAFAVPNQRSQRFVQSMAGANARVLPLPNTVKDTFFLERDDGTHAAARRAHGIGEGERLLVQVSHLEVHKGVPELCEAFAAVAARQSHLRLAVLGSGTLTSELEAKHAALIAAGRLILTGPIPAETVRSWLYAGDAFVLASRRDNNPLSSIEAALCGLPLILSRFVGNIGELLAVESGEWVIPEITVEAIAAPLERFATRPREEIVAHGIACCGRAKAIFRTTQVAANFHAALMALPAGTSSNRCDEK